MARRNGEAELVEWVEWLDRTAPLEREELAAIIEAADMTSIPGPVTASQKIMAAVARGTLSPAIAAELRDWTNLVYAQLCTVNHPPTEADPQMAVLQAFFSPNTTLNLNQPPQQTAYVRSEVIDANPNGKALAVETLPGVVNE